MAQLVAQQGLPAVAGEVQHTRGKGDVRAAGDGLCPRVGHGLALIELHRAQVRAEGIFHLGTHGVGQVHPMAHLLLCGLGCAGAQRVHGRLGLGCLFFGGGVF